MLNRIKELRKQCNMNQGELAAKIGVSASAVGMYEQGRREPDTSTLLKIARCFDVSVDYLIGASDLKASFNIDSISKNIAADLLNQPALMFNAEIYTGDELDDLSKIIEKSVRDALIKQLGK